MSGAPLNNTTWSADTAFPVSLFYDPNHNNYNIPCEGPKVIVVPRILVPANSNTNPVQYILSFTNMIQKGYFTKFQSFYIRTSINQSNTSLTTDLGFILRVGDTSNKTQDQVGPLFCGNVPTLTINTSGFSQAGDFIDLQIFNFILPDNFIDKQGI